MIHVFVIDHDVEISFVILDSLTNVEVVLNAHLAY